MIVNQENALVVTAIFTALSEERFSMRSVAAIKRGNDQITSAQVLETAAQIGCPVRRKRGNDTLLIERPVPVAEAKLVAEKAAAVLAGTEQPFEVSYLAEVEVSTPDLMGDIEDNLDNDGE